MVYKHSILHNINYSTDYNISVINIKNQIITINYFHNPDYYYLEYEQLKPNNRRNA